MSGPREFLEVTSSHVGAGEKRGIEATEEVVNVAKFKVSILRVESSQLCCCCKVVRLPEETWVAKTFRENLKSTTREWGGSRSHLTRASSVATRR